VGGLVVVVVVVVVGSIVVVGGLVVVVVVALVVVGLVVVGRVVVVALVVVGGVVGSVPSVVGGPVVVPVVVVTPPPVEVGPVGPVDDGRVVVVVRQEKHDLVVEFDVAPAVELVTLVDVPLVSCGLVAPGGAEVEVVSSLCWAVTPATATDEVLEPVVGDAVDSMSPLASGVSWISTSSIVIATA